VATVRIAGEGAQPIRSLRFETVDARGAPYLTLPECGELQRLANIAIDFSADGAKYKPLFVI
jgi:hypothetical protein